MAGEAKKYTLDEAVEQLITLAEAAEIYKGLSHSHLGKLVREKTIWGAKVGHYWVTTKEAVEEYLAEDRRPGPKSR